jgi:hypothetical protein
VIEVCVLLWCEVEERKRGTEELKTQMNDRDNEERERERKNL